MKFYFTYGSNHLTQDGRSLGQYYTMIEAENMEEARTIMFKARGAKWSFNYATAEGAGIRDWDLKEISLEDVRLNI